MDKVLVVEDEEAQRLLYQIEISEMGYEVILAKDGLEAVNIMQGQSPNLIVLDLMMPNMHGFTTLRELFKINPSIPVIINTGYSHYKDNIMSLAAERYIIKSSDLTELKNAINGVLSHSAVS